eukprot:CAMPEP_0170330966 /NCGR_PEP_ID=MMETSP0116_2-20130129/66441_1 /TAXON_ID=400756 /ORGANISM="Durinskia baltica, Strain CSIRO CS-38" /LENGTH=240 /DNA_ID=CAMNT_0010584185 /DNA_START=21 /DNA_END=740 /DNA_ORIENTATION=+
MNHYRHGPPPPPRNAEIGEGSGSVSPWRDIPSHKGQWDLTPTPLLLVGADGNVHETRPTSSLARDLERLESVDPSIAQWQPHDDQPVHGCAAAGGHRFAPKRASLADRPIGGFGFSAPQRPTSIGRGVEKVLGQRRQEPKKSSEPGGSAGATAKRSALEPIERLLALGFETDSARAALAAAGGDVERAIRLALEDSEAHDARSLGEWEFEGDKGWVPFDCAADAAIREAVGKGEIACELR